jgi:hypothetical protein
MAADISRGMTMPVRVKLLRRAAVLGAAIAALALALAAAGPAVAGAASSPNTALINKDSITTGNGITKEGTPISLEQFAAENKGFAVTVVSGTEWEAMTAEQFASYQVLIVGDPKCRSTPSSVNSNASTWAPVVMGTSVNAIVGNRTLAGIDPEFHYSAGGGQAQPTNPEDPTTSGAEQLVADGIAFAGAVPGATGVYYDTSCSAPAGDITTLDQLTTTGAGHWTTAHPECDAAVKQIASNSAFATLNDAMIEGWGCSSHVSFPTFPTDWSALAVVIPPEGTEEAEPTCGTDPSTKERACGAPYVLLAGNGIVAESELALTPKSGSQPAGGEHTVTATLTEEKTKPVAGVVVSFAITGTNTGVTGTCTTTSGAPDPTCATDEAGGVRLTYKDVNGVGEDTINASATVEHTVGEPVLTSVARVVKTTEHATATHAWTPQPTPVATPASTPAPVTAVLAAKESVPPKGTARAASIRGCLAQSGYLASVRGTSIASVTFTLDGRAIKTLRKPTSGSTFTVRVNVRSGSAHHLAMRVAFTAASKTPTATFRRTLARCAARKVVLPRFTG